MDWKKLGKALLFPHISIMIILTPIATICLVLSIFIIMMAIYMIVQGTKKIKLLKTLKE